VDVHAIGPLLDDYIPIVLAATATPGATVAIADARGIFYSRAFGSANLADGTMLAPASVLHGGSLSKMCVATAVLQLFERGEIDIHEPISRYLRDIDVSNPLGERAITAYDLLTHQSGLATDTIDATLTPPADLATHLASGYKASHTPEYHGVWPRWVCRVGEHFNYSTFGIATLGQLVAEANPAGASFTQFLGDNVFAPLGMTSSVIPPNYTSEGTPSDILSRMATGYAQFGPQCVPTPVIHSATYPGTALLTTAEDYVRLLLALMEGGRLGGTQILGEGITQSMLTPQRNIEMAGRVLPDIYTGLGVDIRNTGCDDFVFGHRGGYPFGWWAEARAYPRLGFAIVVMANVWDLVNWFNPADRIAPGLIAEFVVRSALDAASVSYSPPSSPQRQASYTMGLLLAERIRALLGADELLDPAMVSALASDARPLTPLLGPDSWDAAAFAAGATAINNFEPRPETLKAFLDSDACLVHPDLLALYAFSFGSRRPRSVMPHPHYGYGPRQEPGA
jgi:CubicO group peptidase (beta-lactamase class C family)